MFSVDYKEMKLRSDSARTVISTSSTLGRTQATLNTDQAD